MYTSTSRRHDDDKTIEMWNIMNVICLNFWKMQIEVDYKCKQRLRNKVKK